VSRGRSLAIAGALIVAALLLVMSEVVVRAISRVHPETGMQLIGRVAFLPYRPNSGTVLASSGQPDTSTYVIRDNELGWTIKPNGGGGIYTATAHGFRGPQNSQTTVQIPEGKIRVSVYGDSFTHGDGVPLDGTWAEQLQHLRANMEVLNFGVPAYGTDQAFLRFLRDGQKFNAQIHILGIWPENLARNVNVIRFYLNPYGGLGTSKPRFKLVAGKLLLINSPVMTKEDFLDTVLQRHVSPLIESDYWYNEYEQQFPFYYHSQVVRAIFSVSRAYQRREMRNRMYFDRESEASRLTAAIAEAFKNEVEGLGSRAYVSIIPMRDFLDAHESGAFPLADMLKARSIPVLDFGPAFTSRAKEIGVDALYLPDGHLTVLGNRLIAEEINSRLSPDFVSITR
jgi:hypothetical protein